MSTKIVHQTHLFGETEETKSRKEESYAVKESCSFCDIIKGALKSYIVLEDDASIAILDQKPVFFGHCLLIPKEHYETLVDLPAKLILPLFTNAQILASAMEKGLEATGSFVAINNRISQSVPHVHIHVIPRREKDGLKGFFWPRQSYEDEEAILRIQRKLQAVIVKIRRTKNSEPV